MRATPGSCRASAKAGIPSDSRSAQGVAAVSALLTILAWFRFISCAPCLLEVNGARRWKVSQLASRFRSDQKRDDLCRPWDICERPGSRHHRPARNQHGRQGQQRWRLCRARRQRLPQSTWHMAEVDRKRQVAEYPESIAVSPRIDDLDLAISPVVDIRDVDVSRADPVGPAELLNGPEPNSPVAKLYRVDAGKKCAVAFLLNATAQPIFCYRTLLPVVCRDRFFDLRLHRLHVERRALLHRRELDEALRPQCDDFLHEDESPELVHEPIVESQ
jgi:hypothetical protein